ncbi:hypothetical protein DSO57_1015543 [Entomophthora muscae]|uniref:Uncharacterized protein n=1 Tax=Entomophthora muscae TaxID=34485 RepID=A0ACC2S778_9FUNG|nr:hypothetical protein DSO57_1015543 [Entomophthora muscae]
MQASKKLRSAANWTLTLVLVVDVVVGILIQTRVVYTINEELTAAWLDRVMNLCFALLMALTIYEPFKMVHVGLGKGDKRQQEWMYDEFLWVSEHREAFGVLPSWLRSPAVLIFLGALQIGGFLMQCGICILSFISTRLSSTYDSFIPFSILSIICGVISILVIYLLNWYHGRIQRRALLHSTETLPSYP